jgi:type I restriction enzyme S subunit
MRVANVQDGYLNLDEVKTIHLRPSEIDRFRLLPGDMLMTEGGDPDKLGRGAIWAGQIPYCAHQNHVFRVRPDRRQILPHFLSCISGSAYGKAYFLRVAKRTTGIASINKTQLSAFPVPLPHLALQEEFERRVDNFNRLTSQETAAEAVFDRTARAIQARLLG